MMDKYEEMANAFAEKTGTKLTILGCKYKPMWGEKQSRYVFKCRLTRNRRSYTFEFGQSLYAGSKEPTMYDVLACLQKYDCGTFEDFCSGFAYDRNSRRAEKTYEAVCKEYAAVERLFGDVMDELCKID